MSSPYARFANRTIPQSEQAHKDQVKNEAGGFSFQVDKWDRLNRFLILGSEGGTYYAGEQKLTKENATCAGECLAEDGLRVVKVVTEISEAGRAPKNSPAIFVLALAASHSKIEVRKAAFEALPQVCRIGTHLMEFIAISKGLRGIGGKGFAKAVSKWYASKDADQLAYQLLKYQSRHGWSHADILKMIRRHGARDLTPAQEAALRWAVAGYDGLGDRKVIRKIGGKDGVEREASYGNLTEHLPKLLAGYKEMLGLEQSDVKGACRIIREYRLTHEMVPTHFQSKPEVWEALLERMPLTAMVRNLGRMTANGLIAPMSDASKHICEQLDEHRITRARMHPLAILVALNTYQRGRGVKGKLTWNPDQNIVNALDAGYYISFGSVEPTGQRCIFAMDVSGSMTGPEISGMPGITPRVGSVAMAMVRMRVEKFCHIVGFYAGQGGLVSQGGRSHWGFGRDGITPLNVDPRQRLDDIVRSVDRLPFGGTDCSLPMQYALARKMKVDLFEIYTDNETWAGAIHPHEALEQYRRKMGIDAKLVVVGMTSNGFTIANPNDRGMLDVVGFDLATPNLIAAFAKGEM